MRYKDKPTHVHTGNKVLALPSKTKAKHRRLPTTNQPVEYQNHVHVRVQCACMRVLV